MPVLHRPAAKVILLLRICLVFVLIIAESRCELGAGLSILGTLGLRVSVVVLQFLSMK